MLTEPPPTRLPFRNGPSGASVQHFVRRFIGASSTSTTAVRFGKSNNEERRQISDQPGRIGEGKYPIR
jgi:hypothetical protein